MGAKVGGRGRKGAKTVLSLLISLLPFASLLLTYSVPPRHKFTASSQHPCLLLFKPSKTQITSFLLSLHQALTPCPHRAGQASEAPRENSYQPCRQNISNEKKPSKKDKKQNKPEECPLYPL